MYMAGRMNMLASCMALALMTGCQQLLKSGPAPIAVQVRFQNARDGFMKKFDGSWHVQPFTQDTLDEAYHQEHKHTPWQGAAMALAAIQKREQLLLLVNG